MISTDMVVWIQNPFDNLPTEGVRKQRYWLLSEAFVRAGHRVVYWTSDFSHARKGMRDEGWGMRGEGVEIRFIHTIPYRKNISFRRIVSHLAYAFNWFFQSSHLIPHPPSPTSHPSSPIPQLIISSCPTLSAASAALRLGRRYGARVVIDVQDAWPETFERLAPPCFRWLAHLLLAPMRRLARRIYRDADLVTGVCDRYRELVGRSDYYRAYLGIERQGVAAAENCVGRSGGGRLKLVYSGNLGRSYDLRTLVRTVEDNADFELDVAGYGFFTSSCPRVRFHGLLKEDELGTLLRECDIGVIPMADDSFVGVPNKMFDYAAAGLGIVSSLTGESAALLEKYKCGTTFRAGDAESLAAAIRKTAKLGAGASLKLCAEEFDAVRIYDDYVKRICT